MSLQNEIVKKIIFSLLAFVGFITITWAGWMTTGKIEADKKDAVYESQLNAIAKDMGDIKKDVKTLLERREGRR